MQLQHPIRGLAKRNKTVQIRSLRNGDFSGTAPFPRPPQQSTDNPHPGGAIRRAGAGGRAIVGSPQPFFVAKTELFRRTSGEAKTANEETPGASPPQKSQHQLIIALSGCVLLCKSWCSAPEARQPPPDSTPRPSDAAAAPLEGPSPKRTLPAPPHSCKLREGLIVASTTRCPTLALAPQRPRVHRPRPPPTPINRPRREASRRRPPSNEGRGERSEPVMPRPATEARQGGLWMRFVAPVEEELEESAPRDADDDQTRRASRRDRSKTSPGQ